MPRWRVGGGISISTKVGTFQVYRRFTRAYAPVRIEKGGKERSNVRPYIFLFFTFCKDDGHAAVALTVGCKEECHLDP